VANNGFQQYPDGLFSLISSLSESVNSSVLVLDYETVAQRVNQFDTPEINSCCIRIPLADWMKDGAPEYFAIRSASLQIHMDNIIVLDSSGHTDDQISSVLMQCHRAWYHLDHWHRAFVLLCDEQALSRFAREMSERFYLPPDFLLEQEVNSKVRNIMRKALVLRWLGHGSSMQLVYRLFSLKQRLLRILL
jgi:hypothetical protein